MTTYVDTAKLFQYFCLLYLGLGAVCFLCDCACDIQQDDLIAPRSAPGLKAPKKLWWAKEITPDLHVAGGLTELQIKHANDAGFKSIISLFIDKNTGDFGGEYLPTAFEASQITNLVGLQYEAVLEEDGEWASVEAVKRLSKAISRVQKPILLHCNRAYTITFTTLMYLANLTRLDPDFKPKVNSENFYRMSAIMGKDFTSENIKAVVAEITGEAIVENPPKPNTIPDDWLDYWLAHPVYKNWYTAGQIRKGHLEELEFIGFKSVINMRQGKITDGVPSQEMVTLVNIKDGTPTYDSEKNPLRQKDSTLKTLVLDPKKDNTYISPTSTVNYESRNYEEYGDEIGYNEDLEREHFKKFDLNYYLLPVGEKLNN